MTNRKTLRQWHRWAGLLFGFFLIAFALSGIVLNHRHFYGKVNISRRWLPESYHFRNWNNGLLRGSLRIGPDSVLIYGAGGVVLTDNDGSAFSNYNTGLPESAEARAMRNVVRTSHGELFACSQTAAYRFVGGAWTALSLGDSRHPRLSDVTVKGDTVVFVGRDALFAALPPYDDFQCIQLPAPEGYSGKVSLFRTLWLLHSGEIFGLPGKVFMDIMGLLLMFFCISGVVLWCLPKLIRRNYHKPLMQRLFKWNHLWHDRMGRYTVVLMLFVTLTGFALRPPLLIALVNIATPPLPYSSLDTKNPWHDKLRALRWDSQQGDWLLSTSEGFYSMKDFRHTPMPLHDAPPVSVMGVNVLTAKGNEWIVGSFSGLYRWHRPSGKAYDWFTDAPAPLKAVPPFGKKAISGYSSDLAKEVVCTYNEGTTAIHQPQDMTYLPMSAWQLALELHTGRLFTVLGPAVLGYIFLAGVLTLLILWTGWRVRKKRK